MDAFASLSRRVSSIQQQLAQLEGESWPGMAEADRDRLQLVKEKEALLQELQLIIQQRRPAEDVARLEEERRRLEEEIQRARATSAQGATERWAGRRGSGAVRACWGLASSSGPTGKAEPELNCWIARGYLISGSSGLAGFLARGREAKGGGSMHLLPQRCQLCPGLPRLPGPVQKWERGVPAVAHQDRWSLQHRDAGSIPGLAQ